jgi:hypothetical protein
MTATIDYCVDHLNGPGGCAECGLDVDVHGNTEASFQYCAFPDCGCDGSRLCQAPNGASDNAVECNVEGMYLRTDKQAIRGRMLTLALSMGRKS